MQQDYTVSKHPVDLVIPFFEWIRTFTLHDFNDIFGEEASHFHEKFVREERKNPFRFVNRVYGEYRSMSIRAYWNAFGIHISHAQLENALLFYQGLYTWFGYFECIEIYGEAADAKWRAFEATGRDEASLYAGSSPDEQTRLIEWYNAKLAK